MAELENSPEQHIDEQQSADISAEPLQQEYPEINKKPFAQEEAPISGMVSSVLKPQDDEDREKIERQIKKRQEKIEQQKNGVPKRSKKIRIVFLLVIVFLFGIFAALKIPTVRRPLGKVYRALTARRKELKIWGDTQVIYQDTFRLKLKSTNDADKATLVLVNGTHDGVQAKNIAGLTIYGMDEQVLTWEFLANNLAQGKYTYKAFIKNSESGAVKELRGSFEIK